MQSETALEGAMWVALLVSCWLKQFLGVLAKVVISICIANTVGLCARVVLVQQCNHLVPWLEAVVHQRRNDVHRQQSEACGELQLREFGGVCVA